METLDITKIRVPLKKSMESIRTEQDYDLVLKTMEGVLHAKPTTPEGDLLEVLSLLIHEYEKKYYAIEPLTSPEALKYTLP